MKTTMKVCAMAAAMAISAGAAAQSVTIYGIVDSGVEYVNNIGTARSSVLRVPTITGSLPSRVGFRGREDLGDGMRAEFVLESGFAVDSGNSNQGKRLFGLQSWVGLAGPMGQVAFGRQLTMLLRALIETDVLGPNIYGAGALDNYLPNARADNMIAYKLESGAFSIGASYSPGRDTVNAGPSPGGTNCAGEVAGNSRQCREWSAMLGYKGNGYGASIAYDSLRGGPGAYAGLSSAAQADNRLLVGGFLAWQQGRVTLNWIRRNNDGSVTPRSDLLIAGVSYDVTPAFNLIGQVSRLSYQHSQNQAWVYAMRASYALSKRTAVYVTSSLIANRGDLALAVSADAVGTAPVPGGHQIGTMIGIRHFF